MSVGLFLFCMSVHLYQFFFRTAHSFKKQIQSREVGWRCGREAQEEGMYVYLQLIHCYCTAETNRTSQLYSNLKSMNENQIHKCQRCQGTETK